MCVLEEKEKNLGAQTAFVKLQHRGDRRVFVGCGL